MKEITIENFHELIDEDSENFTGKITMSGFEYFMKDGGIHSEIGPAVINKVVNAKHYYLDNKPYSKEEWFHKLTEEQKIQALWHIDQW